MLRNAVHAVVLWSTQTTMHFFTLVGGLNMLGWGIFLFCSGGPIVATVLVIGALLLGACLAFWSRSRPRWAPHLAVAIAHGVILVLVALTGGITGPAANRLFFLPIAVSLLLGVRASLRWNALTVLVVLLLVGMRLAEISLPNVISAPNPSAIELGSSASVVLVIVLFSMFYAWSQESALRRTRTSHENLAALLRSVPDAIYSVAVEAEGGGRAFRCDYMNTPFRELLGNDATGVRSAELARANAAFAALLGVDVDRLHEVVRTSRAGHWQTRLAVPGEERLLDLRTQPLLDEHGRVARIVTLVRDLTEVERLSAALARRAEQREVLNDIGRVLVSEHSLDELYRALYAQVGRVLRRDAFYVALWDEGRQQIRFPLLMDEGVEYDASSDPNPAEGPISQVLQERRTVLREAEDATQLDGRWGNTACVSAGAIYAPMIKDGRVLGVLSVQNYVERYTTDEVRLFEALADQAAVAVANAQLYEHLSVSEARFRELIEAIARMDGHAVVVTDLEGVITYAAGTSSTHGLAPESIIGQSVNLLGRNVPAAAATTAGFIGASRAERPWTQPVEATRADGENFPILLSCSPYYGIGGDIIGTVTIGRDLTQERQSQERLLQSAKLASIGELVAGVAHELNNPLTVIKSTAYLLGDAANGAAADDVRLIAEAADRAVRIVRGLLHFSRQTPPRRARTQLNQVVERVLRFREEGLRANGVVVECELAPELPEASADSAQLEQVLLNLVNNAEQALREAAGGGRVTIRTERRGGVMRFSVADNGPGIAPEVLPRIFDPFFTTRRLGEGTGLGLALSHGIVSEHGGTIWAESSPGGGALFQVELPAAVAEPMRPHAPALSTPEPSEPERARAPAAPRAHGARRRVLVVDDEPAIRHSVSRYLTRRGHRVDEAGSGQEALQRAVEGTYDAVILDLKMAGMSGRELYAVLCEHWPELARRVRFATGDIVSPETLDFLESTGRPYLEKPYSLSDVARSVEQAEPATEAR